MIKINFIISFIVFFLLQNNIYGQHSRFERELIEVDYCNKNFGRAAKEVKPKKLIKIFIYKSFNDTLLFKLGDEIVGKYILNTDTINSSSDYSGICVTINSKKRINHISIYLQNEMKYVEFNLIHKRRFYTLHRSMYSKDGKSIYKWNLNGCNKWF